MSKAKNDQHFIEKNQEQIGLLNFATRPSFSWSGSEGKNIGKRFQREGPRMTAHHLAFQR